MLGLRNWNNMCRAIRELSKREPYRNLLKDIDEVLSHGSEEKD